MSDSMGSSNTSKLVPPNPAAPKPQGLNSIFGPEPVDGQLITEIEIEKFTYLWTIKNFSAISCGANSVSSPIFSGSGSDFRWQLHLLLKDKQDGEEYVSMGLHLKDKTAAGKPVTGAEKVMARFNICILDIDGNPFGSTYDDKYYDFSKPGQRHWMESYKHRLMDFKTARGRLIAGDTMKIHCSVSLQTGLSQHVEKAGISAFVGVNTDELTKRRKFELVTHLQEILADTRFADVTISTSTKTFTAHKAILIARSSVFSAMLSTPILESIQCTVEILDFGEQAVKGMLDFIYTGEAHNVQEMPSDMLRIAEKYDLKGLKEGAELVLASNLKVENAAEILVLADVYNATMLRVNAIKFIKKNETKVKTTTSFQNLAHTHPNLIVDIYFAN